MFSECDFFKIRRDSISPTTKISTTARSMKEDVLVGDQRKDGDERAREIYGLAALYPFMQAAL